MAKTQEELKDLKNRCLELKNKLRELNEDELEEVTGARIDFTILPDDEEFWRSFNPSDPFFRFDKHELNEHGLLKEETSDYIKTDNVTFTGSISNREDK